MSWIITTAWIFINYSLHLSCQITFPPPLPLAAFTSVSQQAPSKPFCIRLQRGRRIKVCWLWADLQPAPGQFWMFVEVVQGCLHWAVEKTHISGSVLLHDFFPAGATNLTGEVGWHSWQHTHTQPDTGQCQLSGVSVEFWLSFFLVVMWMWTLCECICNAVELIFGVSGDLLFRF